MSEKNPNVRLIALSDGVIAVAITLLVLDIGLPATIGELSQVEFRNALIALWPRLVAYLLSFLVIGGFWISHREKFNHIVRSDVALLWINLLFLLTISLIPFTANLLAESNDGMATAIYASTMVLAGIFLIWLWEHARRAGLVGPSISDPAARQASMTTAWVSGVFALSGVVSFVDGALARYVWLLLIPGYLPLRRLVEMHKSGQKHTGRST